MIPQNQWYVAAYGREITTGELFGRTICGESILFWRTGAGGRVARRAPPGRGTARTRAAGADERPGDLPGARRHRR